MLLLCATENNEVSSAKSFTVDTISSDRLLIKLRKIVDQEWNLDVHQP